MKNFIKKNKAVILKLLLIVVIIGVIAVGTYFILKACGFTTVEDYERLRDSLGGNIWFWAIIVGLQIIQTIFLPITNQLVTGATAVLYNNELWKVWLSAGIGISIGSIILYFIGRYGGEKIVNWVLGDKEKTEKLKKGMQKGKGFYVIGMFIPFIPDDILSVLAGVGGYSIPFAFTITIVARFTCTAFTTWGFGLLTKYWWMWIVLAVGILFMIFATYLVYKITFRKPKEKYVCPYYIDNENEEWNEWNEIIKNPEAKYNEKDKI